MKSSQKAFLEHFKLSMGCAFPSCFFVEVFKGGDIFINFVAPHFEFGEIGIGLFGRCGIGKGCGEHSFPFSPESFVRFQVNPIIHLGGCCNHLLGYPIVNARSFDVRESQGNSLVGVDHGLVSTSVAATRLETAWQAKAGRFCYSANQTNPGKSCGPGVINST